MRYHLYVTDSIGRTRPWFDDGRQLTEHERDMVSGFIYRHFPQYEVTVTVTVIAGRV